MMTYNDVEELIRDYGHEVRNDSQWPSTNIANPAIPALDIWAEMQNLKSQINVLKADLRRACLDNGVH